LEKNDEKVDFENEIKEELYFVHFKLFRATIMEDVMSLEEMKFIQKYFIVSSIF